MPTLPDNAKTTSGLLYLRSALAVLLIVIPLFVDVAVDQIAWIAVLVAHIAVWTAATHTGKTVMETSENDLDEREIGIRNSASWWGLTTLCSLAAILSVLLIISADRDGALFHAILDRSGYVLVGITLTSLSVPSVVAQIELVRRRTDLPLFVDIDDSEFEDVEFDADDDFA
ncbi:hypothetical protein QMK17_10805 [Rhodococcus sp. G-MC3]|uniref:hypothetical protein n=1 Tax=Rhodococcus sp. G-MC3 TaxID=3046209 RepID=UPI0024B96BDC|nr:hypothetical protein [Rhodococcus sp. G-MC3]MDJ0393820.1 hypothetical protein [Rhodococcus sp. G-MC3]